MRTLGIAPGGNVLLIERRGGVELVHNALVVRISLDESNAGQKGEPWIMAAVVIPEAKADPPVFFPNAVHVSHKDWTEGRSAFAYEELPGPTPGICMFCGCTEERACPGGCYWLDSTETVCSAEPCAARYREEQLTPFLALESQISEAAM